MVVVVLWFMLMKTAEMMIMQLGPAEQLLEACDDEEMRKYLHTKIWEAEYADICNDVFISNYIYSYAVVAQENRIEYVLR